ncbi:protein-tyrosine phosphatase-like protein [Blastocladiella britannica]|nr:protein-tyrosine phosphatase-like protein [Blastocladiella britannica]
MGASVFAAKFPGFTDVKQQTSKSSTPMSTVAAAAATAAKDQTPALAKTGLRLRNIQFAMTSGRLVTPSLILTRDLHAVRHAKLAHPAPLDESDTTANATTHARPLVSPTEQLSPDEALLGGRLEGGNEQQQEPPPKVTLITPVPPKQHEPDGSGVEAPDASDGLAAETMALASPSEEIKIDELNVDESSQIPFLYLSGIKGAVETHIRGLGITHVVNITNHPNPTAFADVQYLRIQLEDTPSARIDGHFGTATDFINKAWETPGARVLVHCYAGISRSTSLVLAYLMRFQTCTLLQAFDLTYRRRPIVQPNEGFARRLQAYEMSISGKPFPSVAHGWLSTSSANYREYLEVCEAYDEWVAKKLQQPLVPPNPTRVTEPLAMARRGRSLSVSTPPNEEVAPPPPRSSSRPGERSRSSSRSQIDYDSCLRF